MAAVLDVLKKYVATGSRFGSPLGALKAVLEARNGSTEAQAGSTGAQAGSTKAKTSPAGQAGRPRGQSKGTLDPRSFGKTRSPLTKYLNRYLKGLSAIPPTQICDSAEFGIL